jgi:hypothetical protein
MRRLDFAAENALRPATGRYRTRRPGVFGAGRRIAPAGETLVPHALCHDGTVRPCAPVPCDAGICWDCLHVCPEHPPALKGRY